MRVAVDGRVMQNRYHGIGRHTFELVTELAAAGLELVVSVPPQTGRLDVRHLRALPNVLCIPSPVDVTALRSQWALGRLFAGFAPDVMLVPYHLSTPVVHRRMPVLTMVHDCIFEREAAALPRGRALFLARYRLATRLALRSASTVATVSEATRRDLHRFYGVDLPHENVIPHGVSLRFFATQDQPDPRPAGLPRRYVLHVGVRRPHKNQRLLVEALAGLRGPLEDVGLVLVGDKDERFKDGIDDLIAEHGLQNRVHQLADVDDAQLGGLYTHACVFAFPSTIEGFGLPILEAMAAGTPVVASSTEAVVEASAHAAHIVPDWQPATWTAALAAVITSPAHSAELQRLGGAVAARNGWAASAQRTLTLLEATAAIPTSRRLRASGSRPSSSSWSSSSSPSSGSAQPAVGTTPREVRR
jgi:glycosyltransferase involved in cell wall biosynthesis